MMEQKLKIVLVGLIGVAIIFGFLYLQTLSSRQRVIGERNSLRQENAELNGRLEKLQQSMRDYTNKISSLNRDIDKLAKEKGDFEKKYQLINQEKGGLLAKIKEQEGKIAELSRQPQAVQKVESQPESSDQYWAQLIKDKADLALQLKELRADLKEIQLDNEELMREKSGIEMDIQSLENEKKDLRRQLEYNQKMLDSISSELVRERNDKMKLKEAYAALRGESNLINRQLKSLNNRKINLERQLSGLKDDNQGLRNKIEEIETGLSARILEFKEQLEDIQEGKPEALQERVPKRESAVELPPIVVKPQSTPSPFMQNKPRKSTIAGGKVLAVNKENNFVVVDLGQNDGIKMGDTFVVERRGEEIAEIEVIQVRSDIAACNIKFESSPIKVNDIIR